MKRVVCTSCGGSGSFQMDSRPAVFLCSMCIQPTLQFLAKNMLIQDNPLALELMDGTMEFSETRGYRIWIQSPWGSGFSEWWTGDNESNNFVQEALDNLF